MSDDPLRLVFHGVRGSLPTAEPACRGYGGDTTCLEVVLATDHRVIVDCGTGLREVERAFRIEPRASSRFDVLLTHYHWDHLIALPLFSPLYDAHNEFTFYAIGWQGQGVRAVLEDALRPPRFPVALADTPAVKRYVDLAAGPLRLGPLEIRHARLHHPQGATAFRFDGPGSSIVFATDHEAGLAEFDRRLNALARGADVLVHDAQYTPEEYERSYRGFGHSTWAHATQAASEADAGRLLLFHHDPDRTDAEIDALVRRAAERFPAVEGARQGAAVEL